MVTKAKKTTKRAPKTRAKHITKTDTHFMVRRSLVVYSILVFVLFWLTSMSLYLINRMAIEFNNHERHEKIVKIYNSLNLDDSYRMAHYNVFGEKRTSGQRASVIEYGHNATVQETFDEISEKIKKAGFTPFDSDEIRSLSTVKVFKNSDGNYIILEVASRTFQNDMVYGTSDSPKPLLSEENIEKTKQESPSYVTIRVNLDNIEF